MNPKKEALRKKLEQDEFLKGLAGDDDVKAYRLFLRAVEKETFELPDDFAENVAAKLNLKHRPAQEFLWFALGIFLLIISCIVAISLTDFKFDFGFLESISSYKGIFLFGTIFIILLHLIDKKWIRATS
ncbi:MAG: hypothetical protein HC859_01805 [Bacteroidia bacterium]|nr:hypothetical protein [Bacteroidia bacterium]